MTVRVVSGDVSIRHTILEFSCPHQRRGNKLCSVFHNENKFHEYLFLNMSHSLRTRPSSHPIEFYHSVSPSGS